MSAKNKCELFCEKIKKRLLGRNDAEFREAAQTALDANTLETPESAMMGQYRCNIALSDLRPGDCGTIWRLIGTKQSRLRLLEMGMTPGTHIKVMRAAAFGGPLDILMRGYQLSLRREEAAQIWLGEEGEVE